MVQVDVSAVRWQQDSDGAWLCLRVKSPEAAMELCDTIKPGKEYTATVQDCRDVGIETMTPRELDALVSRWGEVSV